jgi:hypothetical protein
MAVVRLAAAEAIELGELPQYLDDWLVTHEEVDPSAVRRVAARHWATRGAYVTWHDLAVNGPVREYYLTGPTDTPDPAAWRTEIGWPIFETGAPGGEADG